ncbi:O-antigen ligase family protein [Haloferacaceae archaeon DSL9]
MELLSQSPVTTASEKGTVSRAVTAVAYVLFVIFFVGIVLAHATGEVSGWQIAAGYVVLGMLLVGSQLSLRAMGDFQQSSTALFTFLGVGFFLLAIVAQSRTPGFGLGPSRSTEMAVIFLALVGFFVACTDIETHSPLQWLMIGCVVVLTGIFLYHTLPAAPSSTRSRWPVWAAIVMAGNLLLIPRFIPERLFLWLLTWVTAGTVVLGLGTYLLGDYSLWIFEVRQWRGSPAVPGIETDVSILRSIFVNPNSFGTLAFAGLIAATIELDRSLARERELTAVVFAGLASLNALGLYLSNARAAMLAAAISFAIYGGYVAAGRRAIPVTVTAAAAGVVAFLGAIFVGALDISVSNRFELWRASLQALRDGPLLFGSGTVSTSSLIVPYMPGDSTWSSHNSYLSIFLRAGLLGGFAYTALVAGSVVAGMISYRTVNVGMLALASGWAVHQMFEAYTLFQWSLTSVLATLAVGYLLFGDHHDLPAVTDDSAESNDG